MSPALMMPLVAFTGPVAPVPPSSPPATTVGPVMAPFTMNCPAPTRVPPVYEPAAIENLPRPVLVMPRAPLTLATLRMPPDAIATGVFPSVPVTGSPIGAKIWFVPATDWVMEATESEFPPRLYPAPLKLSVTGVFAAMSLFMTNKAGEAGNVRTSPAAGICCGDQLVALLQPAPPAPVHTKLAAAAGFAVTTIPASIAAAAASAPRDRRDRRFIRKPPWLQVDSCSRDVNVARRRETWAGMFGFASRADPTPRRRRVPLTARDAPAGSRRCRSPSDSR